MLEVIIENGRWEDVNIERIYKFIKSPATKMEIPRRIHKQGKNLVVYHWAMNQMPNVYLLEDVVNTISIELIFK